MAKGGAFDMVTCRFEPLSYLLMNGLVELAFEAWQEIEHDFKHLPHNPDWEAYQRQEESDRLRFIAMRENGKLIGYVSIDIDTEIQRPDVLFASFKDIYVAKSKRGHAAALVRFAENKLSELGVMRLRAGEQVMANNHAGHFYEALGFKLEAKIYAKNLINEAGTC